MVVPKNERQWLSCRDILWVMVFFGFAINYMLRINMSIAIVAMVIPRAKPAASVQCNQGMPANMSRLNTNITSSLLSPNSTNSSLIISQVPTTVQDDNRFAWDEYDQGLVLGAYYWLHWVSQIPGGILARKYGTKIVFGLGNLLPSLLGFFIPHATRQHLYALVCLRAIQGFTSGVTWPAMHSMTAKWIPSDERSKFVSSYLGSSIGAAVTYPICAVLISYFGWESVFATTSALGVVWYGFWCFFVYDSPNEHPRISLKEKNCILEKLEKSVTNRPTKVPWRAILRSEALWVTCIAQWGAIWGFLTFMTQSPTYFNFVHGWNVNATGILSGTPHILRTIFAVLFSSFSDWLLRTGRMTRTNVRKLATFMCTGVQGIFTLGLAFSGCHPYLAAAFMWAGTAVNGAVSSGVLSVLVDLSPNYGSVLLGICGLFIGASGFLSPVIVSALTHNNQTIEQWRIVYLIAVFNSVISCVTFTCFGTAKEQSWNKYYDSDIQKDASELHVLNSEPKSKDDNRVMNDNDKSESEQKL